MARRTNREIVGDAFAAWSAGTGHVSTIFAPAMTWEIVGRSAVAKRYTSAAEFSDQVLQPFGARFSLSDPFRPVRVRATYADDEAATVAIIWDGEGATNDGTTYRNTYAWFLTLEGGLVVDATAFFDSIAFDELWRGISSGQDGRNDAR